MSISNSRNSNAAKLKKETVQSTYTYYTFEARTAAAVRPQH